MKASLVVAALGAGLLLAKGAVAEQAPTLADSIEVDPGLCFDRHALAERIEHWATSPVDARSPVHVRVTRQGATVSFVLLRDGAAVGERALALPDAPCGDTTDAVALAVALALDANQSEAAVAAPAPSAKPPDAPLTEVRESRSPDAVSVPAPAQRTAEAPSSLSATALASVGVLAHAAAGLAVALDRPWTRAFEMHIEVFGVSETSTPVYGSGNETLNTTLLATVLDGCAGTSVGAARFRVCGGPAIGVVLSSGGGIQISPIGWLGPSARVDGKVALTRSLALVASLDGFAPLIRPERTVGSGGGEISPSVPPLPAYGIEGGGGLAFDF